ncbi:DUF2062 domain-containing protein [bacterium]|jgi:uncharacterized protein (DUF2062 family)|nr:DUF2062 domain-containing protein [bacterium]
MIRRVFKKRKSSNKLDAVIAKYNIPREYLSVNRNSVSKAVLVGIFFAFIPMPLQMLAVVLMIPFIKFNVPIGVSLVWITNPVTMPFVFYAELVIGDLLTMNPISQNLDFMVELFTMDWFSTAFLSKLMEVIIPLYAGALFTALILAVVSYYLVRWLWFRSVHHEKIHREKRFHFKK